MRESTVTRVVNMLTNYASRGDLGPGPGRHQHRTCLVRPHSGPFAESSRRVQAARCHCNNRSSSPRTRCCSPHPYGLVREQSLHVGPRPERRAMGGQLCAPSLPPTLSKAAACPPRLRHEADAEGGRQTRRSWPRLAACSSGGWERPAPAHGRHGPGIRARVKAAAAVRPEQKHRRHRHDEKEEYERDYDASNETRVRRGCFGNGERSARWRHGLR